MDLAWPLVLVVAVAVVMVRSASLSQLFRAPVEAEEGESVMVAQWLGLRERSTSDESDDSEDSVSPSESDEDSDSDEDLHRPVAFTTESVGTPTVVTVTTCFPGQSCEVVDALAVGPGGSNDTTGIYLEAFAENVFGAASFEDTVRLLLRDLNSQNLICADSITTIDALTERATRNGNATFDFVFPTPRVTGVDRTLNNAQVDITLLNLGTFGDLRLRLVFDSGGLISETQRFIRPPGQATDMFFMFPINQTVRSLQPIE